MPQWLLLAHQLPARPSNARVKTWRRLQDIGAISNRNSVYVLPNTDQCREDFEWLRSEIASLGGEATVFAADLTDDGEAGAFVETFRRARQEDYRRIKGEAERLLASSRRSKAAYAHSADFRRAVRALRERFGDVQRIDFFHAPGREAVVTALARLDRVGHPAMRIRPASRMPRLLPADFRGCRWVTRPRPGVDRMASAWLIRRFIDPKARFGFAAKPSKSEVGFDMYGGDFGHDGPRCTFETLAERFRLTAPPVVRIGRIVHDLDMKETRYGAPETRAVGRLVDGLRQLYSNDRTLLEQGMTVFEALARSFESGQEEKK